MSDVTPHLDDLFLLRYTAGDLTPKEEQAASEHLGSCQSCSTVLEEVREFDAELSRLASTQAFRDADLSALPDDDPFRSRPVVPLRRPDRGTRLNDGFAARALAASERAAAVSERILTGVRTPEQIPSLLAELALSDPANRFGLSYALQESGRQIAESPVRALHFAEEVLCRLRAEPFSRTDSETEWMVPRMTLRAQAHLLAGQACTWTKEFERAHSHLRFAYRSVARGAADEVHFALVEHAESQRRSFLGLGHQALLLARRATETFEEMGLSDLVARAKVAQGIAYFELGRQEQAIAVYREALLVFERQGLWSNYVGALNSVGTSLVAAGRLDEARREYARALQRLSRDRHRTLTGFIRHGLAEILFASGRYREAAVALAQCAKLYAESGLHARSLTAALFEVESWARHGDVDRARMRLGLFLSEVLRQGALDEHVVREIEEALKGNHPDLERIAGLRQQTEEILQERLGVTPA